MQHEESTPRNLPDFERPPVNEVYLAAQFEPLPDFRAAHVGLFWERLRPDFARIEEHPPLAHQVEVFGVPSMPEPNLRLELVQRPIPPRCWYIKDDGRNLIQLQNDRFITNWRKVDEEDEYPRYPNVRDSFFAGLDKLDQFISSESLGNLVFDQCEVSYINHIAAGQGWNSHADAPAVFTFLCDHTSRDPLPEPENVRSELRYVLRGGEGAPIGRLIVALTPAFRRTDECPIFVFQLTARGRPISEGKGGLRHFLDLGRAAIVNGFAALTTPEMHTIWGRSDNV
jgi:uncharacterized protein (TIGR04255 family)